MKEIKKLISNVSSEVKELANKFPLSMLVIVFVTILCSVTLDQNFSKDAENMLERIYVFCIIWTFGTFFTETFFKEKTNRIISYVLTSGVSLIFTHILLSNSTTDIVKHETIKILSAYVIILIVLSIYKSIKNADLKFEEYCLRVFRDLFNTTTTYIILNIGITIVAAIFIELILDGGKINILQRLMVLILGFYYVPSLIYTVSSVNKKEIGSFIKGLVLYVLLPLTVIAMAIIYIYIAKIIILNDMPENIIYRILAGIFIVAFPVWNMANNYSKDNKVISKIVKLLPYLYAPFILLEIYSIGTRINEFGVTPLRYISCAFIVFQVIALALTFYKEKEKILNIFIFSAVLVFIACVTPLGFDNISNLSQKKIIESIMPKNQEFDDLTDEEKEKVKSAYKYLLDQVDNEKYIPNYLSDEDKNKMNTYSNHVSGKKVKKYISLNKELELNVEEYKNISYVKAETENFDDTLELEEIDEKIDLEGLVAELIKNKDISNTKVNEYFEKNNIVRINDTKDMFISNIYIRYYDDSESIENLTIKGYLLEK
ncbi:MAG: DUF4153 domain-containing protein [Clostridia bacterium]|nr:DUF4153 domain-containing protein [Clostridia bacterium]